MPIEPPKKISEVRAWIAANPDITPAVLAPHPKQRAAERRAALRALGVLATPAALEVLSSYARDDYSDVDLEELHKMWDNFDRRAFASTMFRAAGWRLNLGVTKSLVGIEAVADLTSLDIIFLGQADLTPLAECTTLQRVKIISNVEPSITAVDALTKLPELRSLVLSGVMRNADLSVLAGTPIETLQISLDGADGAFLQNLPKLRTLLLSGGSAAGDSHEVREPGDPELAPAHPGLPEVVFALVRSGVDVIVYAHERSWVTDLVATAGAADDIFVDEIAGRISLTANEDSRDRLRSGMRLNTIAP